MGDSGVDEAVLAGRVALSRVALVADAVGAYLLETLDVDTHVWSTFSDETVSERQAWFTHKG